ncbi:MAG: arginase family protein [Lewinellaceae bacterium]|nr:arginase family protein [Lewinellaceae bacterium]HPR00081.1 arginase family protein [Saprospiraceae bacterium]
MVRILPIPHDVNSSYLRGTAGGPGRILAQEHTGSANVYAEGGRAIRIHEDYQVLDEIPVAHMQGEEAFQRIRGRVQQELSGSQGPLFCFGGDHSISYPVLTAYATVHQPVHVLQLDAHSDLYANLDGNPYSHASPFARLLEQKLIASLTQVGIRSLTPHQREQAARYQVRIIEMKELNQSWIRDLRHPLYLSLDMDVLDPAFAPGISHYEPGGMSSRQLLDIVQALPTLIGADLVEYNPARDIHDMTAMVAYRLMKEIICKLG